MVAVTPSNQIVPPLLITDTWSCHSKHWFQNTYCYHKPLCILQYTYIILFSLFLHTALLYNVYTAYGYGFVMIFTISITSLLGVAIVPFLRQNSRLATIYRYLITLLISMGVAALVCDALLHLIPNVSVL